jgi:hypothetical protein
MYGTTAVYYQAVFRYLFQLANLGRPSGNSSCRGELFVLLSGFWGDGKELALGDGDGDVQDAVDNLSYDGRVFDGGGVTVLGSRGVGGGGIFDNQRSDSGGSDSGSEGVVGPATLVLVSLAAPP